MTDIEPLMLDELRREFARTRPPRRAWPVNWSAGLFRVTASGKIGYRVFWFPSCSLPDVTDFVRKEAVFQLLELLPQ